MGNRWCIQCGKHHCGVGAGRASPWPTVLVFVILAAILFLSPGQRSSLDDHPGSTLLERMLHCRDKHSGAHLPGD
jgi:hypothetical protein